MAVYVDDMRASFGRMVMCHLIADSEDELHRMALSVGLKKEWHQAPPKATNSHYDVSLKKRAEAILKGAVEVSQRQAAAMCLRRRTEGVLGPPEHALEWAKEYRAQKRLQERST